MSGGVPADKSGFPRSAGETRRPTRAAATRLRRGPRLPGMALRIVASRPDPAIVTLPWSTPLEEWTDEYVVPLPRGLSRHVVRIVRLRDRTYAVKETVEEIAFREYRLLRDLQRMGLPAVVPQGVVTGREDEDDEELPAALLTEHLRFSLPYRSLFSHGLTAANLPSLVDALVVLLVRLHLADFFWGDVSLSNVLFRRSAGGFAAYLVDAETGELKPSLSEQMREYDLTIATENVFAELLDLQASDSLDDEVQAHEIVGAARRALPRAVGRADRRGGVLRRRDVAHRAADRAPQRPRLRRRRARHRHRLRRRPGADPAEGRRAGAPPAGAPGPDRAQRRGRPGPADAQRHRGVHRRLRPRSRGPVTGREPVAHGRSTSR